MLKINRVIGRVRLHSTLVIAEHAHGTLLPSTLNTITAAKQLDHPITLLVAGSNAPIDHISKLEYVSRVIVAPSPSYNHGSPEVYEPLLIHLHQQHNFSHFVASHSAFGKNILPRVAARLDSGQISDIISVVNDSTFIRPIYAGNALATVRSNDTVKLLTVRSTAFPPTSFQSTPVPIETVDFTPDDGPVTWEGEQVASSDRPDLSSAKRVVSGGRALGSSDNFDLIYKLADKLGAAVGASRAAVDANYVDNSLQVGQTGKIVAPELYIAIGISGAIQHVAGMKDAKVIVAINKDADAPIFQLADYGLVGDLFKIVPELMDKV